eukprot:3765383-Rhodomonas_salina.1
MHDADGAGEFEGEAPEDDDGVTPLQLPPAPRASALTPPATLTENVMQSPRPAEGITGSAEPEPVTTLRRSARVRERLMKPAQPAVP